MPDEVDPMAADQNQNHPASPPAGADAVHDAYAPPTASPAVLPSGPGERMDTGCLMLMIAGFFVLFALPAFFLLGGAPLIIPLILLLLVAMITPLINPTERRPARARWTGRGITFFILALLLVGVWYVIFLRDVPVLRE